MRLGLREKRVEEIAGDYNLETFLTYRIISLDRITRLASKLANVLVCKRTCTYFPLIIYTTSKIACALHRKHIVKIL
jgi:hypothetical protein